MVYALTLITISIVSSASELCGELVSFRAALKQEKKLKEPKVSNEAIMLQIKGTGDSLHSIVIENPLEQKMVIANLGGFVCIEPDRDFNKDKQLPYLYKYAKTRNSRQPTVDTGHLGKIEKHSPHLANMDKSLDEINNNTMPLKQIVQRINQMQEELLAEIQTSPQASPPNQLKLDTSVLEEALAKQEPLIRAIQESTRRIEREIFSQTTEN